MNKIIFSCVSLFSLLCVNAHAGSYPCDIRVMKSSVWKDYDVYVQMKDLTTELKVGQPVLIPKGKLYTVVSTICAAKQRINFQATFSPVIWEGTEKDVYTTNRFWHSPTELPPKSEKWILSVCFSKDFTSVPGPTLESEKVSCSFPKPEKK